MEFVWAVGVVVGFAAVLEVLDLPERAREVGRRGRACLEVMQDASADDTTKEKELQQQAVRLFGLFGILAGGSLLALGLPLGAVWGLDAIGLAAFGDVLATLERLDFLAAVTVAGVAGWLVVRCRGERAPDNGDGSTR